MSIVVRPFRRDTSDDAGAKALEARASQHTHNVILSTLVKVHLQHLDSFDSKARKYEGSVVLLAIDTEVKGDGASDDGFVCGCICVGIKDVRLDGKIRKLGYLFDMRVHEDYQRRTIGSQLYKSAESATRDLGAEAIYLSVNSTNKKARSFYERYGYVISSHRALLFTPLLFSGLFGHRAAAAIRSITSQEMAQLFDSMEGSDLSLAGGLTQLFSSCPEKFKNAWVLEAKGPDEESSSLAALTLWDGDGTSSIKIERLLLTPATWKSPLTQVSLLLAGCWVLWLWGLSVWRSPLTVWSALSGACLLFAAVAGTLASAFVRFVTTRRRERARMIAPMAKGPRGIELLRGLVAHAKVTAKRQGFGVAIGNLDILDPRLPAFSSGKRPTSGQTLFMLKWLCSDAPKVCDFSCDNFFDPRDMS
mmetsp:Transcript_64068/g.165436  ORF Transcript_64068/g.165436 Transcript_64068/m.165436 type:complete len:419 (+) Transcript_64068:41-1297(+)